MFVLAQASNFVEGIEEGLRRAWASVVEFAPKLIGALLILFIGWLIARLLRGVFRQLFERLGLDRLLQRAGLSGTLAEAGYTASDIAARIVYWIALLIVFLLAAETLDIPTLTVLLSGLIAYLPLLIVAIIVLVVAAAIGSFLGDLVRPWATRQDIPWLAPAARWAVIVFGVVASLNILNVAEEVVNILFIAVVATVGVALAIAFGVGGIKTASDYWRRFLPGSDV